MVLRHARRPLAAIAALAGALILTGCSLTPYPEIPRDAETGGQTEAELDATLATIPGLTFTDAGGSKPNVKGNTGFGYTIELQPGYQIAHPDALIDFLVRSAWSVRDGYMPNTSVEVSLTTGAYENRVDLVSGGEDSGWIPVGTLVHGMEPDDGGSEPKFNTNGYTHAAIWLGNQSDMDIHRGGDTNRERLGDWPGSVPALPAGAVVPRAG